MDLNDIAGNLEVPVTIEIDIGDWDMDANDTVSVAHGLSATEWKSARRLQVVVRNDGDITYFLLYTQTGASDLAQWDDTNVILFIDSPGQFDKTDFDATSYNRGWITFCYTPD